MAIHIDVLLNVRELEMRRASRKLKAEAERLGEDLSDLFSKGFKGDAPKVVKALDSETDAMVRLRRAKRDYDKVVKNSKSTTEQQRVAMENLAKAIRDADRASADFTETSEKQMRTTRERADVIDRNTQAFKDFRVEMDQGRASVRRLREDNVYLIKSNAAVRREFKLVKEASKKASSEHERYNRMVADGTATREAFIRQSQVVRDAYQKERQAVQVLTESVNRENSAMRERDQIVAGNVKAFATLRTEIERNRVVAEGLHASNADVIRDNISLTRSFDRVSDAAAKTSREQQKYNEMVADGVSTRQQLIRQSEVVRDAYEKERRAIRDASAALSDYGEAESKRAQRDAQRASDRAAARDRKGPAHVGAWAARNLGALTPLGVVTPTLVLPLGLAFTQVANAAVAASQAIALLPAAAVAGGAAMGTLAMATSGFGDTIGALIEGDLEKFAEQIQGLSPNAQQAALAIQNLLPILRGIQQATQDAFFADAGQMINDLATSYAPMVQNLTVGIADTMNQAMRTVFDEVMSPEGYQQVSGIMSSIGDAFRNLLPAVQPLAQAFLDLTSAGSSVLPDIATDLAEIARSFADFIREARESGDLGEFMTTGWESLKAVGESVLYFGQMIYDVFGLKSQADIDAFKETMRDMTDVIGVLLGTLKTFFTDMGNAFRTVWNFASPIHGVIDALGGLESILATIIEVYLGARLISALTKGAEWFGLLGRSAKTSAGQAGEAAGELAEAGTRAGSAWSQNMAGAVRAFGWAAIGMVVADGIYEGLDKALGTKLKERGLPGSGEWFYNLIRDPAGTLSDSNPIAIGEDLARRRQGEQQRQTEEDRRRLREGGTDALNPDLFLGNAPLLPRSDINPNVGTSAGQPVGPLPGPYGGPFPVPPKPPEEGDKPSESELLDAAMTALDPSQYRVDPYGGAGPPGAANPYAMFGSPPPGTSPFERGYYESVDPQKLIEADRKVQSEAHDLEEARKKRLALEQTGLGTAKDLEDAKWAEVEAGWRLQESQADLAEAQKGTWKKLYDVSDEYTSLMEGIGAGLEKDFGISKGLPGIADNLVRFIGALATAPMMSQLAMVSAAQGGPSRTGSGLIGIAAQQGLFGSQYTLEGQIAAEMAQNGVSPSAMPPGIAPVSTPGAPTSTHGGASSWVGSQAASDAAGLIAFAQQASGGAYEWGASDLASGLSDCSGAIADLLEVMTQGQAGPQRLDSKGFFTGNARERLTELGAIEGAVPGMLQIGWDEGHMASTLPNGVAFESGGGTGQGATYGGAARGAEGFPNIMSLPVSGSPGAMPGVPGGRSSLSTPFGSIPIPLPVTIVGGGVGGVGPGGAGPGGPAPTGPGGATGRNWDALAQLEAGGDWHNKENDKYRGGLQFDTPTWNRYRPAGAPDDPADATKEQQIAAAENALRQGRTPSSLWPANYGALGTGYPPGPADTFNPANPAAPANSTTPGAPDLFSPENTNPGLNNPAAPAPKPATPPAGDPNSRWQIPPGVDPRYPYGLLRMNDKPPAPATPSAPSVSGLPSSRFDPPLLKPFQTGTFDGPFPEFLPPGTTVATNNTGQPQQVLPPGVPTIMGPNVGMPGGGPAPGPSQYGGAQQPSIPGGSAASGGGVAGAAAGALDMMMPGAGAAASIAMQEISRAIKYGGQVAGIGVQGLMETFLPSGGSELANSNWITRIAGAAAGMAPQLPNVAGKATAEGLPGMAMQQQTPLIPPAPPPGPTNQTGVHIENYVVQSTEDRAGQDIARWNMPGQR